MRDSLQPDRGGGRGSRRNPPQPGSGRVNRLVGRGGGRGLYGRAGRPGAPHAVCGARAGWSGVRRAEARHSPSLALVCDLAKGRVVAVLPSGFRFHDLRHTGNTWAAETGAKLRALMEHMGHSSTRAAPVCSHAAVGGHQAITVGSTPACVVPGRGRAPEVPPAGRGAGGAGALDQVAIGPGLPDQPAVHPRPRRDGQVGPLPRPALQAAGAIESYSARWGTVPDPSKDRRLAGLEPGQAAHLASVERAVEATVTDPTEIAHGPALDMDAAHDRRLSLLGARHVQRVLGPRRRVGRCALCEFVATTPSRINTTPPTTHQRVESRHSVRVNAKCDGTPPGRELLPKGTTEPGKPFG